VPAETLRQAQRYFARLDKFNVRDDAQHDLFAAPSAASANVYERNDSADLQARLAGLDPDAMSPRDALAALYELKRLASGGG